MQRKLLKRSLWACNEIPVLGASPMVQVLRICTFNARGVDLIPGCSDGKESAYNAGDPGSIPGLGRSPQAGNGNPLQYSCLKNPMDRGAWQAPYSLWGHKESDTTERLTLSLSHFEMLRHNSVR